jgi:16S rRNA (guanine527-N7)-methyltransferase
MRAPISEALPSWGALPGELEDVVAQRIGQVLAAIAAAPHNLVGDPPARWVDRHVRDAMALAPQWLASTGSAADVGSGGGFPALVLAAFAPTRPLRLVESVAKKARFLAETACALGFTGVTVDARRAEVIGRDPACRDQYAWVTARALARPASAAELVLPLVAPGGSAWLYLSSEDATMLCETSVASQLGAEYGAMIRYQLPGECRVRVLLELRKCAPTPARYPRRDGQPAAKPLV